LDLQINSYEEERKRYLEEFKRLKSKHELIRLISGIPGIGDILSVKIVATVIDAKRFPSRNHFYSYCGLVKLEKISGGKTYGRRSPRFNRTMKSAMKIAALAAVDGSHPLADYYQKLLSEGIAVHNARNALARKIAATVYGILKHRERFDPEKVKINYVK
jgi:transposase